MTSPFKSGKIQFGVEMTFTRDGYHGLKILETDNFNLLFIDAIEHPVKKVEKGVRIYRVEDGSGVFTIIREDQTFDVYEVSSGDIVLIKSGDSYSYKGELKLFEINIFNSKAGF